MADQSGVNAQLRISDKAAFAGHAGDGPEIKPTIIASADEERSVDLPPQRTLASHDDIQVRAALVEEFRQLFFWGGLIGVFIGLVGIGVGLKHFEALILCGATSAILFKPLGWLWVMWERCVSKLQGEKRS